MGGTFMSMPEDYRNKFIAQLHNALSGFTGTDIVSFDYRYFPLLLCVFIQDEAVRYFPKPS